MRNRQSRGPQNSKRSCLHCLLASLLCQHRLTTSIRWAKGLLGCLGPSPGCLPHCLERNSSLRPQLSRKGWLWWRQLPPVAILPPGPHAAHASSACAPCHLSIGVRVSSPCPDSMVASAGASAPRPRLLPPFHPKRLPGALAIFRRLSDSTIVADAHGAALVCC